MRQFVLRKHSFYLFPYFGYLYGININYNVHFNCAYHVFLTFFSELHYLVLFLQRYGYGEILLFNYSLSNLCSDSVIKMLSSVSLIKKKHSRDCSHSIVLMEAYKSFHTYFIIMFTMQYNIIYLLLILTRSYSFIPHICQNRIKWCIYKRYYNQLWFVFKKPHSLLIKIYAYVKLFIFSYIMLKRRLTTTHIR